MASFFAMKPSSGRRACTDGHLTAKEIERDARDAAMKPSSGRRARCMLKKCPITVCDFLLL